MQEITVKRLYKFVLKKALGKFLAGQLGVDQLDVKFIVLEDDTTSAPPSPGAPPARRGYVQLRDIVMNVEAVNALLTDQPFKLHRGRLGKVEVRVCYEQVLREGMEVAVEGLELVLVRRGKEEEEAPRKEATLVKTKAGIRRKEEVEEEEAEGGGGGRKMEGKGRCGEEAAIIAEWVDLCARQLRVKVTGLHIRVLEGTGLSGRLPSSSFCPGCRAPLPPSSSPRHPSFLLPPSSFSPPSFVLPPSSFSPISFLLPPSSFSPPSFLLPPSSLSPPSFLLLPLVILLVLSLPS